MNQNHKQPPHPATIAPARGLFLLLVTLIIGAWGCGGPRTHLEAPTDTRLNVQTWYCGNDSLNITATLKDDGTLIVCGLGVMMDYDGSEVVAPWLDTKYSITGVVIEKGVTAIGRGAFRDCTRVRSVTISDGVTSIGDFAFAGSAPVAIPGSVTSIGVNALSRTASISVAADNPKYSSIDGVLFNKAKDTLIQYPQGKQDTPYVIPNGVTTIGNDAFANCGNLTNVTINNGVTAIGEFAFSFCRSLKSITIPNSVTRIGWGAFSHSGLTSVTILNTTPPKVIGLSPFLDINENACLYVSKHSVATYRSADFWKDFKCIKVGD